MMNRIFKRPMFRMGGRSDDGIMSMRPGFQEGGNLAQRFGFNLARGADFLKRKLPGSTGILNLFRGTGQPLAGTIGPTATTGGGISTAAAITPALAVAALADESYPVYPKGHENEGERMSIKDAQETLEKTGGAVNIATGKRTQAGGAGDIAGEAAMFDLDLPKESGGTMDIFGNMNYPTKRNFDSPQAIEVSKQIGLLPEDPDDDETSDDDGDKNKGSRFDKKADLKTIYEDLLPMMKETLDDPDDKRRQLYTQLAQFGANLLAQPGGDLVGAVGRAAAKPIEGVGKVLARDADIDREAKILALKTAIDRTTPGATGKLIQDLKALDFSDDEIMKYLEAQKPGAGQRAAVKAGDIATLKDDLTNDFKIKKNAGVAARTMYESILAGVDETQYSELPASKDERVDGEYYVSPNGQVGRYDSKTGTLIKPGEKGFTGSKKKKS
jgi:hypothetical protein